MGPAMNGIVGDWDVTIKTPIGSLHVLYTFANDSGVLTGTAAAKGETVPVRDVAVAAQWVTRRQSGRAATTLGGHRRAPSRPHFVSAVVCLDAFP